ncbi:hypothetical protein Acr_09g0001030 [Actinidia rufa]|uniref:Uncharacterized protein n=1 Tax=Actinidia rufa TaxID=165716 RepID=A0A7J0F6X3_9ERIC|nr:hypothetical protein Acr_09g0001030 [Actinidia rufa]
MVSQFQSLLKFICLGHGYVYKGYAGKVRQPATTTNGGTTSGGGGGAKPLLPRTGIIARLCGGRHVDSSGDHDMEGWVERKCRSCIDGGVPAAPPPPEDPKPPATEAAKK